MADEKRLIDANKLMDLFRRYMAENCDRERCISEDACKTCERECIWRRVVRDAPTVDAVEVVHGRWIEEPVSYLGHDLRAVRKKCSVCGWVNACRYNYCPSCGAKMDGGNDNG